MAAGILQAQEATPTPAATPSASAAPSSSPSASPVANASATPDPAVEAAALAAMKAIQDSLIIVTEKEGAGSGFVGVIGGVPMLITNAHVIAGATQLQMRLLSSAALQPGKGRLAFGHDVAAFEAPAGTKGLEISNDVAKEVAIGDAVVICGNSLGGSVVTELKGKVVGIGPDVVEVDAPFVPGNSGSPIYHVKSGKVIGIATYITTEKHDKWSKDSNVAEMRRFGYRLDTIKRWDDLNWPMFQSEAATVNGIKSFTEDYFDLWRELKKKGSISGVTSVNPRIQRHLRDLQRAAQQSRGGRDFDKAVVSFLWDLKSEAKQEFLPGRPVPRYWFTNHEWNEQKEMREEIGKDLDSDISERNASSY
ncbi:hypothetical protein BH09VER1_BH09VER1_02450 [soil metagenome]